MGKKDLFKIPGNQKSKFLEALKKQTFILFYFVFKLNSLIINRGVVEEIGEVEPKKKELILLWDISSQIIVPRELAIVTL